MFQARNALLAANALPSYPIDAGGPVLLIDRTAHASIQVLRGIYQQIGPVHRFNAQDTEVLRKFGNPLIFGGPISLPMISVNLASARLHVSGEVVPLQELLWRNTAHFDQCTLGRLVNSGEQAPVRGAMFPTESRALAAAQRLKRAGVLVTPAFYPTVAKDAGLVRFAVSALHTEEQVELAAEALGDFG